MEDYRMRRFIKIVDNKLIVLVGDASSGLVYQKGLNKGFLESLACSQMFTDADVGNIVVKLNHYSKYCKALYLQEKEDIMYKHNKINSVNTTVSVMGKLLLMGGLVLAGAVAANSFI